MIKLAIKDLRLFFADKRSMMLTFAVPIALISLFAFAFGGAGQEKGKARPTNIVIADDDKTAESQKVIAQLDSLKELEVTLTSVDTAEGYVKKGDEPAILVFHKGFGDSIKAGGHPPVEFKYDAAKEAEVGMLEGALTGHLMNIIGEGSMAKSTIATFDKQYPDMDSATRMGIHAQIMKNFSPDQSKNESASFITSTPLVAEKENSPGLIHAVAGTAIMMLLFSVVGMGASMLDEKQEGTLKKLLYSPLHPDSILFGKMIYANLIKDAS